MHESDLQLVKRGKGPLEIWFADGTAELIQAISVFDEESDPDLFYERVSSSGQKLGAFGAPLPDIVSVRVPASAVPMS